jgi:hypothetical protein
LNPLPILRAMKISSKKFYLFGDGIHFSNLGHRVIADFIRRNEPGVR